MQEKITDPDEALDDARVVAEEAEQGDILAFIDMMDDLAYTDDDGVAELGDLMDTTLPFYEDERALAVLLAFTTGAAIERKYSDHRLDAAAPAEQGDDAGDIEDTV
jgi:GAF domain-containing protein